jgi:hypothetical protein
MLRRVNAPAIAKLRRNKAEVRELLRRKEARVRIAAKMGVSSGTLRKFLREETAMAA